jgi:hypothetical protein
MALPLEASADFDENPDVYYPSGEDEELQQLVDKLIASFSTIDEKLPTDKCADALRQDIWSYLDKYAESKEIPRESRTLPLDAEALLFALKYAKARPNVGARVTDVLDNLLERAVYANGRSSPRWLAKS